MDKRSRNLGIELFRVLCMLGIVCYHLLGHGWIIQQLHPQTWKYEMAKVLESVSLCGVTGFALVSGYTGVQGRTRYASLALQWMKVWLYSMGFTLLAAWIHPGAVSREDMISACFPVLQRQYWYFSAYAGCFLMTPFIKSGYQQMNRRQATISVGLLLAAFCVLNPVSGKNPFDVGNGKNTLWLIVMYVLGAYLKAFDAMRSVQTWKLAALAALGVCAQSVGALYGLNQGSMPTAVWMSAMLLLLFARIPVKRGKRLAAWLGASSFGVYLIHDHAVVRQSVLFRYVAQLAGVPKAFFIPAIVLTAAGIYLCCAGVDALRERLFVALRLRERLYALEEKWLGSGECPSK